jgi:hypothetical protein
VVTSISGPSEILRLLAQGCQNQNWKFILIGDEASPSNFELEGCDFYGLDRQKKLNLEYAGKCPTRHYARKNIGYLMAVAGGAKTIVETDDDNIPMDGFWNERQLEHKAAVCEKARWVNVYKYFSERNIWPRGFPLDEISAEPPKYGGLEKRRLDCPIQQSLADDNPDVDAVYRLTMPLPVKFAESGNVALDRGSWCPFNSQNTTWLPCAYPLMYLPAYCSFRMTDIWRSFVAQRIAQENDWPVLFTRATMRQERNAHNLMRDFADEVPGYLNNKKIVEALAGLKLESGREKIGDNLRICYDKLVTMGVIGQDELALLNAWLGDLQDCEGC